MTPQIHILKIDVKFVQGTRAKKNVKNYKNRATFNNANFKINML